MKFINFKKNIIINLIIVISIFLIDRISKIYVIKLDNNFNGAEIFSSNFLNIYLIWNEGIAFGLLSMADSELYNFISILISVIILVIIFMIFRAEGIKKFALLMILGGAIGNLYDRIIFGAVPDFIDFHIGNFHWFIFNFADVFITLGVFFMILIEFAGNNKDKSGHEKF
jgi:signal peptidase II